MIVISHLSDLHISGSESTCALFHNTLRIAGAITALAKNSDLCLIAVSGDITQSGKQHEFELARKFFEQLRTAIQKSVPAIDVQFVLCAGNHDCDISLHDGARDKIINGLAWTEEWDGSIDESLSRKVLGAYEVFAELLGATNVVQRLGSVARKVRLNLRDEKIEVLSINTAWTFRRSSNVQTQPLVLPARCIRKIVDVKNDAVCIILMHHPETWLAPENAREMRNVVQAGADIVLTGHEHVPDSARVISSADDHLDYIYGGVLGDPRNVERSSFNILQVDTVSKSIEIYRYDLNGDAYVKSSPVVRRFDRELKRRRDAFGVKPEFEQSVIDDPGVRYTHPRASQVRLGDLFIYPDARRIKRRKNGESVHSRETIGGILDSVLTSKNIVILGDDQSGKTSIAKRLCIDLRRHGIISVLLSGREPISTGRLESLLDAKILAQVRIDDPAQFWGLAIAERAVIVDDFDRIRNVAGVLSLLERFFGVIVLTCHSGWQMTSIASPDVAMSATATYDSIQICELGFSKRYELIKKWHLLGIRDHDGSEDRLERIKIADKTVTKLLSRELVPPFPVFVLAILQILEQSEASIQTTTGSYGYFFENFIFESLRKAKIARSRMDTMLSYLSALAWHVHRAGSHAVDEGAFKEWHKAYLSAMGLGIESEECLGDLVAAGILSCVNDEVAFRYGYIYQYFVAKYISQRVRQAAIRAHIESLSRETHLDDSANIIIFLCHLCKDEVIIDSVLARSRELFGEYQPADLTTDVKFLNAPESKGAALVLVEGDEEQEQERARLRMDRDKESAELEDDVAKTSDDADPISAASRLQSGNKLVLIQGQILREFVGSLTQERKVEIARECYELTLRIIAFVTSIMRDAAPDLVTRMQSVATKNDAAMLPSKAIEIAWAEISRILLSFNVQAIRHLSSAVGVRDLKMTFDALVAQNSGVPYRLIDVAINLDHGSPVPRKKILELANDLGSNAFTMDVLRVIVWVNFYLFSVTRDYKTKQAICAKLNINYQKAIATKSAMD